MFYSVDIQAFVKETLEIEADSLLEAREKAKKEFKDYHDNVLSFTFVHVEELPSAIEGDQNGNN